MSHFPPLLNRDNTDTYLVALCFVSVKYLGQGLACATVMVIAPHLYSRSGLRMHLQLLCHGRCLSLSCCDSTTNQVASAADFYLHGSGGWSARSGASMVADWWGFSSWYVAFLLCFYVMKRDRAPVYCSSYENINLIMGSTLMISRVGASVVSDSL